MSNLGISKEFSIRESKIVASRFHGYTPTNNDLYIDNYTLETRSFSQDREIQELKDRIKEQEQSEKKSLDSLIAYYYNR